MFERVTDNVYADTTLRGCNPSFVVTSDGVVVIDTPQLPTKAVEMRKLAEWIDMWSRESQAWSADIFALGDFNQDRYEDPDNEPFNQLLEMPDEMNRFPRTIFTR